MKSELYIWYHLIDDAFFFMDNEVYFNIKIGFFL